MIGRSSVLLCCIALLWLQPCSSFLPYLRPLHHLRKAYISNSRELRMHATLAADTAVLSTDKLPSLQAQTATFSLLSTKIDFNEAIEEVVSKAITALNEQNSDDKIDAVVFQVSTAYETTIIDYQVIGNELRKAFPALQHIIGSTTSCPIAPLEVFQLPIEQESRHGIAMQFYSFKKHNIDVTSFRWTSAQVQEYIHNPSKTLFTPPLPGNNAIAMVVAPQMIKRNISALCSSLYQREGLTLFGSIPSAVNMLQAPKTFYMNSSFGLDESTDDLVGLKFEGDVDFATYVANSIKAVGPLFEVAKFEGNTVLTIKVRD